MPVFQRDTDVLPRGSVRIDTGPLKNPVRLNRICVQCGSRHRHDDADAAMLCACRNIYEMLRDNPRIARLAVEAHLSPGMVCNCNRYASRCHGDFMEAYGEAFVEREGISGSVELAHKSGLRAVEMLCKSTFHAQQGELNI